jgi:phosphoglycolate phosphatase
MATAAAPAGPDLASVDNVIFDCDGVLWNGDTCIDGVPEVLDGLRALGKKLLFLTNNSTKSRTMAAAKFEALGIGGVVESDIVTSGYSAAKYLEDQEFERTALVIGMPGLLSELAGAGIKVLEAPTEILSEGGKSVPLDSATFRNWEPLGRPGSSLGHSSRVGAVVVGMDVNLTYAQIARAALELQNPSCVFIATNMDAADNVGCGERPRLMPGAGAAVGAVMGCTGRTPINCGKGGGWIIELLQKEFELEPSRTLMVGDRLDTDIAFGAACGMMTLLPLTGVTSAAMLRGSEMQPDFVIDSVGKLAL